MSEELRKRILLSLKEHHESGSVNPKFDHELAAELGQPVDAIQDQLTILEEERLVKLGKLRNSSSPPKPLYYAFIEPKGRRYLEELDKQRQAPKKRTIGFLKPKGE